MNIAWVRTPRMLWRVEATDPPVWPLKTMGGWGLLNPRTYLGLRSSLPMTGPLGTIVRAVDSGFLCETIQLFWLQAEGDSDVSPDADLLLSFCERLQFVSKQGGIGNFTSMIQTWMIEVPALPELSAESPDLTALTWSPHLISTVLSRSAAEKADALGPDFRRPVFDSAMLAAVEAYAQHRFRDAILGAAIGMEAAAVAGPAAGMEGILGSGRARGTAPTRVVVSEAGVPHDPVYDALESNATMRTRLHELPLYVLGRSLRLEDKTQYDAALRLYRTRNALAHGGVPTPEKCLSIDGQGAREALRIAAAVIRWFFPDQLYHWPAMPTEPLLSQLLPYRQ